MSKLRTETVTEVHHWNDALFSIKTTRDDGLRFRNGEFAMIGLVVDGKPLLRAYSIASPNYEEHLEFFSIKVQDGPLTSRLQHIKVGDELLVSKKPTGTLVLDDLLPGKHLYMLSTGTGVAPFLALARDPEVYERFEKVILVHGVRGVSDLAYREMFENELPNDDALLQHAVFVVHIFARLSHHLMNGSKRRFTVVRRIGKPHGEIVVRIFEIRQVNVDEPL